jgi:hypothetical protein
MSATYDLSSSYKDHGTVRTVFSPASDSGQPRHAHRLSFRTGFIRGKALRFELDFDSQAIVIWSDSRHTYTESTCGSWIVDDGSDLGVALTATARMLFLDPSATA